VNTEHTATHDAASSDDVIIVRTIGGRQVGVCLEVYPCGCVKMCASYYETADGDAVLTRSEENHPDVQQFIRECIAGARMFFAARIGMAAADRLANGRAELDS
jgi:hypothetical protein